MMIMMMMISNHCCLEMKTANRNRIEEQRSSSWLNVHKPVDQEPSPNRDQDHTLDTRQPPTDAAR